LSHLQRIHEAIWGELYPWAGEIRTIGIAKDGVTFCPVTDIPDAADHTFGRLAAENTLRGLGFDPFVERLTAYHGAVNYLHPFREGNGRAQRAFLGQLAREAGYDIRWDRLDPVVNDYASHQQTVLSAHEPMRAVFAELVDNPDARTDPGAETARLHDLTETIRADAARHRELADHLRALADEGRGHHVTALLDRRDQLARQALAIQTLDDAALGHTPLTVDESDRLAHIAGPEPGRTSALVEHRVLTERFDSLHASSRALDELAAHHPADLARRQNARANRITRQATALTLGVGGTAQPTAERLHAARLALVPPVADGQAPDAGEDRVPGAPGSDTASPADPTPPAWIPTRLPARSELHPAEATDTATEAFRNDGIDAGG
ncbi:MAG TPA: Fic family protein, partial [Mycobacteriales bacterium]|nr:Fic family protein [Mycobacteriales bacterium]